MKYLTFLASVATVCMTAFADPVSIDGTGKIITFDVDEADYPESAPFDYTATWDSVAGTVTNLIKRGTGSVMLGTDTTISAFRGAITVEANGGFLMGWKSRFGKPTTVTVKNGGAMEFTEVSSSSSGNVQTAQGSFADTQFYVEGPGPDGHGALQRPNAYHCTAADFFKYITLTGDTTINLGSRWGINNGTLDMGGYTLTFKKEKHARSTRKTFPRYSTPTTRWRSRIRARSWSNRGGSASRVSIRNWWMRPVPTAPSPTWSSGSRTGPSCACSRHPTGQFPASS